MRGIDRHGLPTKVLENPLDHRRFLDAGDDAQPAAASPADLDVYGEYAPPYKDGLPVYVELKNVPVARKLDKDFTLR